jgi:hypothetical protein
MAVLAAALAGFGALPAFAARAATAPEPDYSGYQQLLDEFLVVVSAPGAPIETRFDYARLRRTPDLKTRLAGIRKQLFEVEPTKLGKDGRRAWAINAYNFLVLEAVTHHLYESTERHQSGGKRYFYGLMIATVQTIQLDRGSFFESPLVDVDGAPYSLNAFERTFVFDGFDPAGGAKPPATLDPRAHFGLVCAARGCPPLLPRAYRGDSLDRQLDFAVRNALSSRSHLRIDPDTGRLEASSIFDWYKADFGGVEAAFAFLKKHAPAPIRSEMERRKSRWINVYILWDWGLNAVEANAGTSGEKTSG